MNKERLPVTQAIRVLREHGVAWTDHPYAYEERGGTEVSARELGVPEHQVVKTLIMEDEHRRPLIVPTALWSRDYPCCSICFSVCWRPTR